MGRPEIASRTGGEDPSGSLHMRSHEILPHTADAGIRAVAPDPSALFEEAAVALAEVAGEASPGVQPSVRHDVVLEAADLPGLAFTWLNELISLADVHHAAVLSATVDRLEGPAAGPGAGSPVATWRLVATVGTRAFREGGVRPRLGVKSATYHGLEVKEVGGSWELCAYLDV